MNIRQTVEQDWYLHPTKGWKRGQKRKRSKFVTWTESWPLFTSRKLWKRYR